MNRTKVFIVEDDEELGQLLKIRIESLGHQVIVTDKGDEVVNFVQTHLPDLVLLDVFLPDTDGLTILKRLKSPIDIETGKPSHIKDIPVVVLTGKAPMIENMTRIEGAADFFIKPIDMEKLMKCVHQLLELRQHDQGSKS